MYNSLLLPWSPPTSTTLRETLYRKSNLLRTKGTIFLLPPSQSTLLETYNQPPRPKTRMSSGAVALCKHFERGGASEHGIAHPYWRLPVGSNDDKSRIAREVLEKLLEEVVWRNVMLLHPGVAVYEVRNARGWGMRWTLEVVDDGDGGEGEVDRVTDEAGDMAFRNWRIVKTTFRGFVEPIEGMDHELDSTA